MTTFAAALLAAWERKASGARPYASEAVAAVLLDRAGVSVEDVETSRVIVVSSDEDVSGAVTDLAIRIWPGRAVAASAFNTGLFESGKNIVVANAEEMQGVDAWQPAAGETGAGVLATVEVAESVPWDLRSWMSKVVTLDRLDAKGVVESVVQLVTGTRPVIIASVADVNLADIRTALGPRDPAQAAVAMMTILRDRRAKDYRDKLEERRREAARKEVPPEVVTGPAHERDTPLSQLSGFGDAKRWGLEVAADLVAYRQGELSWADVDRGVLLSGPPGVGKTRFARALAAEAGVPFYPSSFSALCQNGASGSMVEKNLKKLFDEARKNTPSIVFLDEMDSVSSREAPGDHNSSYFTAVINAFLETLDGSTPRDGVVVIAASNHPEKIDPALKRPGRLEREIAIPLPGVDDLVGIIKHHIGWQVPPDLGGQVRLAAQACRGMSPADVEQACRDARRRARRDFGRHVALPGDIAHVLAMRRVRRSAADERVVGTHEAGHAVLAIVQGISLDYVDLDRQHASGERAEYPTAATMDREMAMLLGGRAAEEVVIGQVTSGSRTDLAQATAMAMRYHAECGFGDVAGLMALDVGRIADGGFLMGTVRKHLDRVYADALRLVRMHRASIERVAVALARDRYLDAGEVRALIKPSLIRLVRPSKPEPVEIPEWAPTPKRRGHGWGNCRKGRVAPALLGRVGVDEGREPREPGRCTTTPTQK